jgi:aryl-alcohol dehydrogenase-like predicted oxidoreductase
MGKSGLHEKVPDEAMIRFALGTAQFGLDYGVANRTGQVGQSEVAAILNRAAAAGIDTLDTAIAYGQSEACLGKAGMTGWRVITKLPPLPPDIASVSQWIDDQIGGSLRRLGIAQLEAVLLHSSRDLLGPHCDGYLRTLTHVKSAGLTRALGVSIYEPAELDDLWPIWRPDIVQAPCNVLDRRLIRSGWLERLTRHGVRVHVRSAFLQGLLLMPPERRPDGFEPWSAILNRWTAWCNERGVSALQGALAFVRNLNGVEFVVVGVDAVQQLQQILALSTVNEPPPPEDIFSEDRNLIDPSRWRAA